MLLVSWLPRIRMNFDGASNFCANKYATTCRRNDITHHTRWKSPCRARNVLSIVTKQPARLITPWHGLCVPVLPKTHHYHHHNLKSNLSTFFWFIIHSVLFSTLSKTYLDSVLPSVDVVPQEHETSRRENRAHAPKNFLKTYQVMEVAMKVT